jgi:putative transcriptional regulator
MSEDLSRNTITIRIRDLRRERSLTQEELADALGISRQSVNAMESGRTLPSLPVAMQMAQFFAVPLSNIFVVESAQTALVPWSAVGPAAAMLQHPAANVWQDAHAVYVELRVPGFRLEELAVEVTDRLLIVRGQPHQPELRSWDHREFITAPFERRVELSADVLSDHTEAGLRAGILAIRLPKQGATMRAVPISDHDDV